MNVDTDSSSVLEFTKIVSLFIKKLIRLGFLISLLLLSIEITSFFLCDSHTHSMMKLHHASRFEIQCERSDVRQKESDKFWICRHFFDNDVKNLTYVSYYPRTSDISEFELDRDEL